VDDYDGGLLFFYFSSSDLQSHLFWWSSDEKHPPGRDGRRVLRPHPRLYQKLDQVVGEVVDQYGSRATICS